MGNPSNGEIAFDIGDRRRTVRFTTSAICTIEAEFGVSFGEVARRLADLSFVSLRSVLRAVLDGKATMAEAADIIDKIGYQAAFNYVMDAYKLAFPPPDEENPQMGAEAGTGTIS